MKTMIDWLLKYREDRSSIKKELNMDIIVSGYILVGKVTKELSEQIYWFSLAQRETSGKTMNSNTMRTVLS